MIAPACARRLVMRSCIVSNSTKDISPLATQRWLVTTITEKPARFSRVMPSTTPVSYTHLDVYKRQPAMDDAPGHPLKILAEYRSLTVEVVLSANAAHNVD